MVGSHVIAARSSIVSVCVRPLHVRVRFGFQLAWSRNRLAADFIRGKVRRTAESLGERALSSTTFLLYGLSLRGMTPASRLASLSEMYTSCASRRSPPPCNALLGLLLKKDEDSLDANLSVHSSVSPS